MTSFTDKMNKLMTKREEKFEYNYKLELAFSFYKAFISDKYKRSFDVCDPIVDEYMEIIQNWRDSIEENEENFTDAKMRLYNE